eukprot:COSAG03_NODE_3444_length_2008_cov_2.249869_1_plen_165_part_00
MLARWPDDVCVALGVRVCLSNTNLRRGRGDNFCLHRGYVLPLLLAPRTQQAKAPVIRSGCGAASTQADVGGHARMPRSILPTAHKAIKRPTSKFSRTQPHLGICQTHPRGCRQPLCARGCASIHLSASSLPSSSSSWPTARTPILFCSRRSSKCAPGIRPAALR